MVLSSRRTEAPGPPRDFFGNELKLGFHAAALCLTSLRALNLQEVLTELIDFGLVEIFCGSFTHASAIDVSADPRWRHAAAMLVCHVATWFDQALAGCIQHALTEVCSLKLKRPCAPAAACEVC